MAFRERRDPDWHVGVGTLAARVVDPFETPPETLRMVPSQLERTVCGRARLDLGDDA